MKKYQEMSREELMQEKTALEAEYAKIKELGLALDMSRGKPAAAQLDLSMPMLDVINSNSDMKTVLGNDTRNYGDLDGIGECRRLMAAMMATQKRAA